MVELMLSIVVPVYKVEKELPRCIESIVNQDFDSKEVLLIDDGSPDKCGKICDEYEKKYRFIRVIHQKNQGLAAVRNAGIRESRGRFISFIDSDDYIQAGLYSHLFSLIDKKNADIACFGHVDVYTGDSPEMNLNYYKEIVTEFSALEAMDQIFFENSIDVITCNKIIKKELFEGILFPDGKLYEDMFTTYKYLSKAKRIIATNYKYYIYCHRPESIGGQKYNDKTMDLVRAVQETYDFGRSCCTDIINLNTGYLYWMIVVANIMIRSNHQDKVYFSKVQELARKYRNEVISSKLLNKTRKYELLLFGISLPLYRLFYLYYIKHHR